jgi:hypothetical protein
MQPQPPDWRPMSPPPMQYPIVQTWPVMVPVRPSSTVAVWALVTGVVGVIAGWCLLGLPCVAAIILGHIGVNQTKNDAMTGRGMAVAGLVLGYVAMIPAVILFFWMVAGGLTGGAGAATTSP